MSYPSAKKRRLNTSPISPYGNTRGVTTVTTRTAPQSAGRPYIPRGVPRSGGMTRAGYQQTHVGGEIKAVDVVAPGGTNVQGAFNFNTTAQFTALNLLTVGSSAWNRIGRKISMKSLYIQGNFQTTATTTTQPQFARMIVVYDKQPNGALPAIADLLRDQANSATDSNVTSPQSGLNLNNRERFEIIRNLRWTLPAPGGVGGALAGPVSATADHMHFEEYAKLGNREVHYKADSAPGVIGDLATGCLFICTLGNLVSGSEPYTAVMSIRLRYTDQ